MKPTGFLVCNDIHLVLEFCSCILFADDTTIYKTHKNTLFLEWCLNEDLKLISDWFRVNKLTLNPNKTACMFFNHSTKTENKIEIKIDNIVIPQVDNTKFLGIKIDQKLNWKNHVDLLLCKLKSNTKILQTNKKFVSKHVLKLLYYSQVYSHLIYCIRSWGNHIPQSLLHKLQQAQNKCISIIVNKKHVDICDYKQLGLLCVNEIIRLENLKFAYKLYKNLLLAKIINCSLHDHKGLSLRKKHSYNTRNEGLQNTPKATCNYYLRSIFCGGIHQFLSLKEETNSSPTLGIFVNWVKNLIMKGNY